MRVKNKEPLPLCAMDISDEYQKEIDDESDDDLSINNILTIKQKDEFISANNQTFMIMKDQKEFLTRNNQRFIKMKDQNESIIVNNETFIDMEDQKGSIMTNNQMFMTNVKEEYIDQGSYCYEKFQSIENHKYPSSIEKSRYPIFKDYEIPMPYGNKGFIPYERFPIGFSPMKSHGYSQHSEIQSMINQESMPIGYHGFSSNHESLMPIGNHGYTTINDPEFLMTGYHEFPMPGSQESAMIEDQGYTTENKKGSISSESQGLMSNKNEEYISFKKQTSTLIDDQESITFEENQNSELSNVDKESPTTPDDPNSRMYSVSRQLFILRQLCSFNDDPIRKQFFTDLFNFMARRGTPINQIPIIGNSILDLYHLFQQVIKRGGLVQVIKKKRWMNIIKELNLHTKSHNCALTLRNQYIKYLYDYECYRLQLSNKVQLFAIIDHDLRKTNKSDENMDPMKSIIEELLEQEPKESPSPTSFLTELSRQSPYTQLSNHSNHLMQESNSKLPDIETIIDEYLSVITKKKYKNVKVPSEISSNITEISGQSVTKTSDDLRNETSSTLQMSKSRLKLRSKKQRYNTEEQTKAINLKSSSSSECSLSSNNSGIPSTNKNVKLKPSLKRPFDENNSTTEQSLTTSTPTRINIVSRGDAKETIFVCLELHGVTYQGVLFAKNNSTETSTTSINER
ncbi:AT-rich interactive domain-containing protein 3A-like [Vespa crabro]|uniref:AT-rich interactive domain-containing protein 3A-like n=1 Tax=Vespa crabro TaxID=7445 RepID=UPI001F005CA8|nr:AT-rich interactive domain-containing protein 3A-like [Vespa crabro]XP_046831507.1 AT-rich interactive domain-containing protein 3A-like [Vespa crabro]